MLGFSSTIWLIIQLALAAGGAVTWIALVLPSIAKLSEKRLLLDVWGPLIVVGPILFGTVFVDESVAGIIGWQPIAGPILVGMLAFGIALLRMQTSEASSTAASIGLFGPVVWTVSAIILLLLAAVNVLTVLVGQCVFAAAAVALWISTPGQRPREAPAASNYSESRSGEARAIIGMLIVAALAIAQGIALLSSDDGAADIGCLIALGYAGLILCATATAAPPADVMRFAGWSAAIGATFGIGLLSLLHMLPSALRALGITEAGAVLPFHPVPTLEVAYGFAALAPEATGLLGLGIAALAADRMGPLGRKTAATLILLAACCLLLWRVL